VRVAVALCHEVERGRFMPADRTPLLHRRLAGTESVGSPRPPMNPAAAIG
jgi:hypothetical protein